MESDLLGLAPNAESGLLTVAKPALASEKWSNCVPTCRCMRVRMCVCLVFASSILRYTRFCIRDSIYLRLYV